MTRRILLVALVLLVMPVASAAAQEYPGDADAIVAADTTLEPGAPFTFTARSFGPGSDVRVTLVSTSVLLGTFTADEQGVVNPTVTIPADTTPGEHTIEVAGTDNTGGPLVLNLAVTVAGVPGDPPNPARLPARLPATGGDDTLLFIRAGAGLLASGGIAVFLLLRRRRSTAS